MPELPEVETIRRGIEPWLVGHTILQINIHNMYLRWPIASELMTLRNRKVLSVQRRAKYLLLELNKGWIIIHLGMSGRLKLLSELQLPEKHDHVDLVISNGCVIRYTDPRRFGAWLWSNDLKNNRMLGSLGIEPLSDQFNGCWLFNKSRNKKRIIKLWLMDHKFVVGIGNIYANESLFNAGILPSRSAASLSKEEAIILANSIKILLSRAIEQGGTTLRDFMQPNNNYGYFTHELKIYGHSGEPCQICGTMIKTVKHNHRSTYFCPYCQN